MKEDNKELEENFLSRWSKKKSKQKSEREISKIESADFNSSQGDEVSKSSTSEVSENDKLNDDELLKKYNLPNPEKIKKEKSLDVFFKDGVPDRLRQIALRRVWRLNPIIRFADAEINDYHEDFTDAATVIEGMETAYKVGKGYLSDLIDDKDEKNDVESITPIQLSTDKSNKKKIKKISKGKNQDKKQNQKQNDKTKLISEKDKKNNVSKIGEIKKDKNLIEQTSTNTDEIEISLQNSNKKIKPKPMVFKPKISKNDYNQKI